jgi:saccharopine dehydrogenase-like NADP-dependent oxidoreductase
MRYPGHMQLMRFFFHELLMEHDRKLAGEILVNAKPPVSDDVVYIHAAVEGWKNEKLESEIFRSEFVKAYYPVTIDDIKWRAISWTTAASVVAIVELLAQGKIPQQGYLKQENISLEDFLLTKSGAIYNQN